MRILFLQLLLISAAVLASGADKATFSGKWQIRQTIAGNENTQTCTFTQNGNDLTGSCVSEQNTVQISGKVDDKKVTWSFKTEYNGSPLTLRYSGPLTRRTRSTGR